MLSSVLVVLLSGCASSAPAASDEPEPTPTPWDAAPADGEWESGDVSFGDATPIRQAAAGPRDEYEFRVESAPVVTTDDGRTVTVASAFAVTRVHDKGFGEPISDSEAIHFAPGESSQAMSEAYGTNPAIECGEPLLQAGEATTCVVSFAARAHEVRDFYWSINGLRVGAWPSQVTAP